MEILVYRLEEMTVTGIEILGEYHTEEEAEEARECNEDRFTRIVKKEVDSTEYDLEDAFIGLCTMMKCTDCPYGCLEKNTKPWNEFELSEKVAIIKKMVMKLKEERG